MQIWFLSNHRILCLVLKIWNQEKNTEVSGKFLSSNGRISSHFDNFYLKLSTNAYFET